MSADAPVTASSGLVVNCAHAAKSSARGQQHLPAARQPRVHEDADAFEEQPHLPFHGVRIVMPTVHQRLVDEVGIHAQGKPEEVLVIRRGNVLPV